MSTNIQLAKQSTAEAYRIYKRLKNKGMDDMQINNIAVTLRMISNQEDYKLRYRE